MGVVDLVPQVDVLDLTRVQILLGSTAINLRVPANA